MSASSHHRGILWVAIVAIAFRIMLLTWARPTQISDAGDYWSLARTLVSSGEYVAVGRSGWDNGLTFHAYRPPGYPVVRAALLLTFGASPWPALWLNVLCEGLTTILVGLTARSLYGPREASWAAIAFAPIALFTSNLLTESLSMAQWAMLGWIWVRRAQPTSAASALGAGLLLASAIFVRPISVIWLPLFAIGALRRPRHELWTLAVPLACIALWGLRNHRIFGTFVWMSTNLGVHNSTDFGIPWTRLSELRRAGLDEARADRALQREILDIALQQPARTAQVLASRLSDLFSVTTENCWELGYTLSATFARAELAQALLRGVMTWVRFVHVAAVIGILNTLRRRRRALSLVLPLGSFVLAQCIISRGDVRLVAPALPMLAVYAGRTLARVV